MKQKLASLRAVAARNAAKVGTAAGVMVLSGSAMAAVPAAVTDALTEGLADVATVAGAAFLIVVAVAVWRHLKKAP